MSNVGTNTTDGKNYRTENILAEVYDSTNKLLNTSATISGDINVDNNSVSTNGLIGKSGGADFTTAYASATTVTIGTMPFTHTFIADDVISVQQINTSGAVVNTYTRDDKTMTVAGGTILTVTGATFAASDTFIIYTNISRNETKITGIGDGRKVVSTAGTAEALGSSTSIKEVTITAETNNTDMVVVGSSTVVAAVGTRQGSPLYPGDTITLKGDNLADFYVDSVVSTEGVTFNYLI